VQVRHAASSNICDMMLARHLLIGFDCVLCLLCALLSAYPLLLCTHLILCKHCAARPGVSHTRALALTCSGHHGCAGNDDIITLKADDQPDVITMTFEDAKTERFAGGVTGRQTCFWGRAAAATTGLKWWQHSTPQPVFGHD
jgi:hypothetical protein